MFCLCLLILENLVGDFLFSCFFYRKMSVKFFWKIDFVLLSFLLLYQTAFCFSNGMRTLKQSVAWRVLFWFCLVLGIVCVGPDPKLVFFFCFSFQLHKLGCSNPDSCILICHRFYYLATFRLIIHHNKFFTILEIFLSHCLGFFLYICYI